jgi:glyoxylase-like metal-dependent hydrolase (beta-lactamase superfamily II)
MGSCLYLVNPEQYIPPIVIIEISKHTLNQELVKKNNASRKRILLILQIWFFLTLQSYSQENIYEIFALEFGHDSFRPMASDIAVGSTSKDTLTGNFVIWLLKGNNGKIILVDAGFTDTVHYPQKNYTRPDKLLEKINIKPRDISDIIVTHPHWDHIGGIDLFPNAMLWMQQADFDYFVGSAWQHNGFSEGFNKMDVFKLIQKNLDGYLTLVKGDNLEIIPGIRVFIGSKHTFESQYVLVNGTSGKTIIASDNIWFYHNLHHLLPIPKYTFDPIAYVNAMKRMKTLVSDTTLIIPGHDASVFSIFPKVREEVVRIELKK